MIDLHLHTTASDGKLTPAALVALAAQAGLRVISVTDHDTVAGLDEAHDAAARHGIRVVDGIEITAIERGRDVHVLGYFFDRRNAPLASFLEAQRADRIDRVREIAERLRTLRCEVDVEAIIQRACRDGGRSVGRPLIADALIAAGHAVDRRDAFDRLLGNRGPAYVPRRGPSVERVAAVVDAAGGLTALAHPGLIGLDDEIPRFIENGISAIEARHREHDASAEKRYRELAHALGVAVSGGSDFHGEPGTELGVITLAAEDFELLEALPLRLRSGRTRLDAST